jgi:DNA-directed RNA polymerase beta subunit
MIQFKNLRQYTHVVNAIRWLFKKNPYILVFFSENTTLLECYEKLNILKIDVRNVIIPRTKIPVTFLTTKLKTAYRSLKIYPFQHNQKPPAKRSLLYDTSIYTSTIDELYKPSNYRTRSGVLIKRNVENAFYQFADYEKVLMYCIDLTKPFNKNWVNRKFYLFIRDLKKQDFDFDHLLLTLITEKGVKYRLLVKNKQVNFERIFPILKSLKYKGSYEEDEEDGVDVDDREDEEIIKHATKKVIDNTKKDLLSKNVEKVKTSVNDLLNKEKTLAKKIIKADKNDPIIKKTAIQSVIYKNTNNLKISKNVTKTIPDNKTNKVLKKVEKEYVDELLVKEKTKSLSSDKVIETMDIEKQIGDKNPSQLYQKRIVDFSYNFKKDLTNSFKTLEKKDIKLKIQDIVIEDKKERPGEINRSDLNVVKVELKDMFNNNHTVSIEVPKINPETGTFKLNGETKYLVNQIILCPISFPKPYDSRFTSSYSAFHIESLKYKNERYLRIFMGNYKIPLIILMWFTFGFDKTMTLFDLKYNISEENPKDQDKVIQINKDKYLYFTNINSELKKQLFNSLLTVKFEEFESDKNFGENEYFNDLIIFITGIRHSTYMISLNLENIVDPVAKQVLINQNLPYELDKIMKYMSLKVIEGKVDDRNDLKNQRIRGSEVLIHLIQKQLLAEYTKYKEQVLSGNKKAKFEINPTATLSAFINSEIVSTLEFANPIEELAAITKITPVGKNLGGVPSKESIQVEMRNVHPSYYGNIDPIDTPEGENIGVNQQLAVNALITSARGLFKDKKISDTEGSGILSVSSSMIPFVENNDGARIMMSCAQMKQALPLKNPEPPIVLSGYESIVSEYLSNSFIKKAPFKCRILEINRDFILVSDEKGKKHNIDIKPIHLKSGFGRDTLSVFIPVVKTNQVVQKGQILAEGSGIKDGSLCLGRSFLIGYMPYKGYNFEDGIVINEKLIKEDKLTSLHAIIEEVLVEEKDRILEIIDIGSSTKKGEPLIKKTVGTIEELLGYEEDETISRIGQDIIKKSPGGVVVDIEIYTNIGDNKFPKIKYLIDRTRERYGLLPKDKFYVKGKLIKGILIKFKVQQEFKIGLGDKLTGRYGNKGIISLVEKDENMPRTPWGEKLDIVLNPVGIIGRMNIGQLFELYSGLISKDLALRITKNNSRTNVISLLKKVLTLFDNSKNKEFSTRFINNISNLSDNQYKIFIKSIVERGFFPLVFIPFQSPNLNQIKSVMKVLNLQSGYNLYLPEYNIKTHHKVPVGYSYISKLEHIAELKIHARSTGKLTRLEQPTGGKKLEGGQRFGEADTIATLSYNAVHLLSEMMGPLSDDRSSQNEMISEIIQQGNTSFKYTKQSLAREQLDAYFNALMLDERKLL